MLAIILAVLVIILAGLSIAIVNGYFAFAKPQRRARDGITYRVANGLSEKDQHESAVTLADINSRIMTLLNHLSSYYKISPDPTDPLPTFLCPTSVSNCSLYLRHMNDCARQVVRLLTLYQADRLEEHLPSLDSKETSSTINKGAKIKICLRDKTPTRRIYDINTLMFVTIHELAHVACDERTFGDPHTERFWEIFRFLLLECYRIKLFNIPNYNLHHKNYSGVIIKFSPIHSPSGAIRWFENDLMSSAPPKSIKGGYHPF
jgi:hypothetical protein